MKKTAVCIMVLACVAVANAAITNYFNFETAPVHPIALGPDGHTLAVCNLPDNRVELFDVSFGVPAPVGSVPVGLDPVTARFASSNELWVVNHISSTISIVDVAARTVVATLETPAGPSDLVFAGTPRRAWVSCSRTNAVFVIDPATRTAITNIAIDGERPRAMAASPDGSKVYVAIFESGNGTTILGRKLTALFVPPAPGPVDDTNGPYAGADPPPNNGASFNPSINPLLPGLPPRVSHIVRKNDAGRWMDDNNGDWTEWVSGTNATNFGRVPAWDMPDRDLAIIDTATLDVGYAQRLMNLCMAVGVNPVSGEIAVVGTDATNEKRFEPVLKGIFLRVKLALVDPVTRTNQLHDLNPHLDYITRQLPPEQRALSVGDPRGIEWNSDGTRGYIAGTGSRNLIVVDANGQRVSAQPIELGEGPTGIALDEPRSRLYVWNRFSSSISVVDTAANSVVTNLSVFDPTPEIVRQGRRHLYDTRNNSGLGQASCASCHPDARMDRLAWDLGDPSGLRATNGLNTFHPMKGPMVTQTLQDIIAMSGLVGPSATQQLSLHWRGDRKNIEEFNPTFPDLLGRETALTTNEMAEFKQMLSTIFMPPNFLRTFSNTLSTAVPLPGHFGRPAGGSLPLPIGNAQGGANAFNVSCRICHAFSSGRAGPNGTNFLLARSGTEGQFLFSQLRNLGEKTGMNGTLTNSRTGFGFMHDGRVDTLSRFLIDGFPQTAGTDQNIANLVAFMLSFNGSDLNPSANPSQDVPASAGRQITFGSSPPAILNAMSNLAMLANSRLDLAVRGKVNGQPRSWLLRRPSADLQSDRNGEVAPALTAVTALAGPGNEFTATLIPRGSGQRWALDRDGDGYFDTTEIDMGYSPADPTSLPGRILSYSKFGGNLALTWESAAGLKYAVEWTTNSPIATSNSWSAFVPSLTAITNITGYTDAPPAGDLQRFYRIRKEP